MISANARLDEQAKIVVGFSGATPSTSVPDYVSLKGYERCSVLIQVNNGATVTGVAVTLKQATAVANTGEKALAFTRMKANADIGATDVGVETAVTSNTFTTATTNDKDLLYILDVQASDLDVAGGFDCIRAGTGDGVNAVTTVIYVLYPAKYAKTDPTPSAILD